jgi:hypothetical protein
VVGVLRQGCPQSAQPHSLVPGPHLPLTLLSLADDNAFEPAEASPPIPGDGGIDVALPRHLEQSLPPAEASLADLEDSADSSSALLVPSDSNQSGSAPAAEPPTGGSLHSRGSLNTVV